jgi:hypothetical protein
MARYPVYNYTALLPSGRYLAYVQSCVGAVRQCSFLTRNQATSWATRRAMEMLTRENWTPETFTSPPETL